VVRLAPILVGDGLMAIYGLGAMGVTAVPALVLWMFRASAVGMVVSCRAWPDGAPPEPDKRWFVVAVLVLLVAGSRRYRHVLWFRSGTTRRRTPRR
jgi:hypothetical protein